MANAEKVCMIHLHNKQCAIRTYNTTYNVVLILSKNGDLNFGGMIMLPYIAEWRISSY